MTLTMNSQLSNNLAVNSEQDFFQSRLTALCIKYITNDLVQKEFYICQVYYVIRKRKDGK